MISDRLIQIVIFLKKHERTSYKELAFVLDRKERQVRYDIDRINDTLKEHDRPLIQKLPKGVLMYPHGEQISEFFEKKVTMYNQQQRIDFILLYALFDVSSINLRRLSEEFCVSRSSIKNDVKMVDELLLQYHCTLVYEGKFKLYTKAEDIYQLMVNEFSKYVYMYGRKRVKFNAYEIYAKKIIQQAFQGIDVKNTITWIKEFLEHQRIILSDKAFIWYVSSVMTILWYALHNQRHPLEELIIQKEVHEDFRKLDDYIKVPLSNNKKQLIMYLLRYVSVDKKDIDDKAISYVCELIAHMESKLAFPFAKDDILYNSLLKFIQPMIRRYHDQQYDLISMDSLELPKEKENIVQALTDSIQEMGLANYFQNNELHYVSTYFIASIYRSMRMEYKRILLICGIDESISTYLKERLISEFHVEVIDVIPSYKLQFYQKWKQIDYVITIMNIDIECIRPVLCIHPLLNKEDTHLLEAAGINRRRTLPQFYHMQEELSHLSDIEQKQIMNSLRKCLGYRNVQAYKEVFSIHSIINITCMMIYKGLTHFDILVEDILSICIKKQITESKFHKGMLNYRVIQGQHNGCLFFYNISKEYIQKEGILVIKLANNLVLENKDITFVIVGICNNTIKRLPFMQQLSFLMTQNAFISDMGHAKTEIEMYKFMLLYERRIQLGKD